MADNVGGRIGVPQRFQHARRAAHDQMGRTYLDGWEFQGILTVLASPGILAVFVLAARTLCQPKLLKRYSSCF